MANGNIASGSYNFGQLKSAPRQDRASVYAAIGQQLNKQYYENRQAYITNVANPLSQVKARKEDNNLLADIKGSIIEKGNEFKERNDWSQAANYVYDATENILTNEGLKAITQSYALEQQYLQDIKGSGWDTQNQTAFILRSKLNSSPIQYDKENNIVIGGGFSGVTYGKPMDIQGLYDKIADIASKAKASGSDSKSINATSAYVQGMASLVELDGETFLSNFMSSTFAKEGVSYDRIAQYAKSRLESSPEYINHLKTVSENNTFLSRYKEDPSNPKGGYLEDFNPNHLRGVFKDSYILNSLAGRGIDLSDLGAINKNGTITLNKNMSKDTKDKIDGLNLAYGINLYDILSGKKTEISQMSAEALSGFFNEGFGNYINNNLNEYINSLNLSEDTDKKPYIEQWYQNVINQDYIKNTINGQSDSIANLMSWQKTKSYQELVSNNAFGSAFTEKKKRDADLRAKLEEATINPLTLATTPDIQVNSDIARQEIESKKKLGDQLALVTKEIQDSRFSTDVYSKTGIPVGDVNSLKNISEEQIARLSPEDQQGVRKWLRNVDLQNNIKKEIEFSNNNIQAIYDEYNKNPDTYNGIGWYKIADDQRKYILKNNITTYEQYLEHVNKTKKFSGSSNRWVIPNKWQKKSYIGGSYDSPLGPTKAILSKDEFEEEMGDIVENIVTTYNDKNPQTPLKFAVKGDIVFNPNKSTQQFINTGIASIKTGTGDWVLESTTGKGNINVPLSDQNIISVLTTNSLNKSITTNNKGVSVTERNAPISKSEGIDGSALGIKGNIFDVEWNPVFDSSDITRDGNTKLKMQATFKGRDGQYLGSAIVSRPITKETYNQLIQDNYNGAAKYHMGNPDIIGDNIFQESMGKLASQAAQSAFSFNTSKLESNTVSGFNVNNIQQKLANTRVGEKVYTDMEMILPYNGSPIGNMTLEIEKVGINNQGDTGFKVRAVRKDGNNWVNASNLDFGNGEILSIPTLQDNAQPVNNIMEALLPLSNVLLQIGYNQNEYNIQSQIRNTNKNYR